jgi:hypothetical protein
MAALLDALLDEHVGDRSSLLSCACRLLRGPPSLGARATTTQKRLLPSSLVRGHF